MRMTLSTLSLMRHAHSFRKSWEKVNVNARQSSPRLEGGVITLSAAEQTELADDLLKVLPEGRFSIDETPGDFLGGVVITHGRIRDNLTYDLTVRDHRQELARIVLEHMEERVTKEELGG